MLNTSNDDVSVIVILTAQGLIFRYNPKTNIFHVWYHITICSLVRASILLENLDFGYPPFFGVLSV